MNFNFKSNLFGKPPCFKSVCGAGKSLEEINNGTKATTRSEGLIFAGGRSKRRRRRQADAGESQAQDEAVKLPEDDPQANLE